MLTIGMHKIRAGHGQCGYTCTNGVSRIDSLRLRNEDQTIYYIIAERPLRKCNQGIKEIHEIIPPKH